jgi:hypothetical protein
VRDPDTPEFPVVVVWGSDLDYLTLEVSGSEKVVALAKEGLGISGDSSARSPDGDGSGISPNRPPRVFVCPASENKPQAERIAKDLMKNGIDTFFDKRFIPLRSGLTVVELPPVLKTLHSPELSDYDRDLQALVGLIHGVSDRPPLGPAPEIVSKGSGGQLGLSPAAEAIVRYFVEHSEHGLTMDPVFLLMRFARSPPSITTTLSMRWTTLRSAG